jgi:hypothetical protein
MILPQETNQFSRRNRFMQGYTAESYRVFVRSCLDRLSNRAGSELKAAFQQCENLQAETLNIIVQPKGILNEMPIRLFFVPGGMFELGKTIGSPFTPAEKEVAYRYDNSGVETLEIELQVLIEWLSACWQTAQGPELAPPAFLSIENDLEALDLREMSWVPNPAIHSKNILFKKENIS